MIRLLMFENVKIKFKKICNNKNYPNKKQKQQSHFLKLLLLCCLFPNKVTLTMQQRRGDINPLHKEKILDSSDDVVITTYPETNVFKENKDQNNASNKIRKDRSPAPPLHPPPPIPTGKLDRAGSIHNSSGVNNNNSNNNNNNGEVIKKFKVCTWNLWCMPFSSPRTLSNPYRCASYVQEIARAQQWENLTV
ncbi:hypothetical protein RFI_06848 [Reticulomyxa filosa]|uniref:Uncharacterized protein n=1 Tax=Reticulomyxa filosa TaxID=46433 RepID=X6NYA2_RETFI|nr:hypothetical protein RFI_06848 [Reticulomyxa filosa]|eukprot:ETO30272.1 hypothetical protein RFI_06848 [Reticulomyxa filosa]